jgi:integrase
MQTKLGVSRTGYWEVRWSERLPNGKFRSRAVSTGLKDRGEAEEFRKTFTAQMKQAAAAARGLTISELADHYELARLTGKGKYDTSVRNVKLIVDYFGAMTPDLITDQSIQDYIRTRNVSSGTARRELVMLIAILNHALRKKLVRHEDVPSIDLPAAPPPKDLWLNEKQEEEFYNLALAESIGQPRLTRVTRFVCIALDTGQRRGVIRTLTWDKVDFAKGTIDFRKPTQTKSTKKKAAVVPISKRLRPILELAYSERTNNYVLDSLVEVQREFDEFVARTPYPWVTAHVLRHTCATLMMRAGVSPWQVAGILGNSLAMVTSVYAHHAPDHLRDALEKRFA